MKNQPQLEPTILTDYLIRQGILTPFQAERVLQGKTENLVLGPYTVTDAIGFGSMGMVYKAQSKNDQQWYALKLMPRRSMWNVRIAKRLVRAFEKIRHPAVVRFVDVNTVGANLYLAWPYVEGESLEAVVQRKGRLLPGLAALFTLQAAEGLSACHHQGLIHGLLKPANLLVGSNQEIRVLDFGIGALLSGSEGAELVDTMSTANAVTSGLDCRSPENILDVKVRTPAGDQYSLGCIVYFCLTGQYPFPGETAVEKMLAHQVKEPTPIRSLRPEVPQHLVEIVQRMMHKTPEGRYSGMDEVIETLRPIAVTPEVAGRLLIMEIPDSPAPEDRASSSAEEKPRPTPLPPASSVVSKVPEELPRERQAGSPFDFQTAPTNQSVVSRSGGSARESPEGGTTHRQKTIWIFVAASVALLGLILWLIFHG